MKRKIFYFLLFSTVLTLFACNSIKNNGNLAGEEPTLKNALKDKFYIGTALNSEQIQGRDTSALNIVKKHFSAIVAENCMKSMYLQPREGRFFFDEADKFVEFGEKNNLFVTGHTLIWHSQVPSWFFTDEKGENVSAEVLKERMRKHINTVVSRYKGRVKGWDVVNEAILDDGKYRESKFYEILGEEFIPLAFQYANEADPDAELYYNDYNEWMKGKRDAIVNMIKSFKEKGIRIDGVGMQGHVGMGYPRLEDYKAAIDAYAEAGVKVMITEFDMSALPPPRHHTGANISDTEAYRKEANPYTEALPDSVATRWSKHMMEYFTLFLDNADKISRVTMWGVNDGDSWRNGFPIHGRTDYPLLFDRNDNPKPIVQQIIDKAKSPKKTN